MILIGSKHGNVDVDDVLYGRQTVRETVFEKMKECQIEIQKQVAASARNNAVSFCTDMTTDDVNKNSYSDLTMFWVKDWKLHHGMYKCEYFPEKHTAQNIQKFIDDNLKEMGLSLVDPPCTTDKGSNVVAATASKTHVDCSCHRLNTSIDTAWKEVMSLDDDIQLLDTYCHELVKYANQATGIQSRLPTSLKHGGETRPWRSLTEMFSSISKSRDVLAVLLKERKKETLIGRIDVDILNEIVEFLNIFPPLFDILEYANIPTLQNSLPVYYTLYEAWQPQLSDTDLLSRLKKEFEKALTNKYWDSLKMLHFVATYLDLTLKKFLFVKDITDRQSFVKQAKQGVLSLATETVTVASSLDIQQQSESSTSTTHTSTSTASSPSQQEPAKKKIRVNPFEWFQSQPETVLSADTNNRSESDWSLIS